MNKGQFTQIGDRAWSYNTALVDRLPDGRSIGNATKYSVVTSKHQKMAGVHACDVKVDNVPQGTDNLAAWYLKNNPAK